MNNRVLRPYVIAATLALIPPPAFSAAQDETEDVVAAIKMTRSNERDKAKAIDDMLFDLSSRTVARRVLEAARKGDRAVVSKLVATTVPPKDGTVNVEQVEAQSFCMRLRVTWQRWGGGTSNVTIGCR